LIALQDLLPDGEKDLAEKFEGTSTLKEYSAFVAKSEA
jgi:hypothetical protein